MLTYVERLSIDIGVTHVCAIKEVANRKQDGENILEGL